ncbi:MAG: DivIVA domain-containing protein, partial [Candidatus Latescibacteria bacterium]|nr:DivIVA domain-containing protein [bacterium]MBD3424417.1 DivIVA domain-containing protein [Candidatus Latescibacterota bacterium]
MRITPLDIRKQEFKKSMRGLDSDEVYAFLTTVAQEYENVLNDNKQLREHIVDLRERLKEFKNMETNLRDTLLTAEKLTADAKENARHEADLIIKEAEIEAEKASQRVRAEAERLRNEVLELRKQKENYIVRFKTLIDTHRQMILNSENDFAHSEMEQEKSGWKWENRVEENDSHHRMSRERITEEFSHDVEEENPPSSESAEREVEPEVDQRADIPEAVEQSVPASREKPAVEPEMKKEVSMGERAMDLEAEEQEAPGEPDSDSVDEWVEAVSPPEEDQEPMEAAPRERSDEWKEYQVESGETDWKEYNISE